MEKFKAAIVIGAGNWGRPLAGLLARNVPVRLWTIDHAEADSIIARRDKLLHKNSRAQKIVIEPKFTSNIAEQDTLIVMAVPSSQVSDVAAATPLVLRLHGRDTSELVAFMKKTGIPTELISLGFNNSEIVKILVHARDMRERFTVLNTVTINEKLVRNY